MGCMNYGIVYTKWNEAELMDEWFLRCSFESKKDAKNFIKNNNLRNAKIIKLNITSKYNSLECL
jgi:hypothetical protein